MCINYNDLSSIDKANITKLINAKKALDKAKALYDKEVAKSFDTIKNSGSIKKDFTTISYIQGGEYITLDTVKVKNELPDLYQKYSKTVSRKDTVKVIL